MTPDDIESTRWVDRAIAADAARLLDLPHVVHVYDQMLGVATVLGPFPTPLAASAYADQYRTDVVDDGDGGTLVIEVIPLEPVESQSELGAAVRSRIRGLLGSVGERRAVDQFRRWRLRFLRCRRFRCSAEPETHAT